MTKRAAISTRTNRAVGARKRSAGQARSRGHQRSTGKIRRFLFRLCSAAAGFGLLGFLVVWAKPLDHLQQVANRPISGVTVEGEFRYLSQQKMQALLSEQVTGSFLQLDMVALKHAIEENPWVDSVSVSRQWPDRLVVRIKEQQPIARWGGEAFLNMRGDVIKVKDNGVLSHLPLLQGPATDAREVMEKYVRMMRLLSPSELRLQELHMDKTHSWTLTLRNGMIVKLGRNQVFEKLRTFVDVYPANLAQREQDIARVDLRYANGFAVAWKQQSLEKLALAGEAEQ